MKVDVTGLTAKQKRTLPLVVGARTIVEGLAEAGISPAAYYKWLKESPAFKQAVTDLRDEMFEIAMDELKQDIGAGLGVLRSVALDTEEAGSTRVSAVREMLTARFKHQSQALDDRIDDIVEMLEKNGLWPPPPARRDPAALLNLTHPVPPTNGNHTPA